MHRAIALASALLAPGPALPQARDWAQAGAQDGSAGTAVWTMLVLLALLAFAVHLAGRRKQPGLLRESARGLAFAASAYLAGFFFLACVSGIARLLQLVGIEKEISALVAVPLGLLTALWLYGAYQRWRAQEE